MKKKCLDTDRTLKNLELKFQKKLNEKVQEILHNEGNKLEYVELEINERETPKLEEISEEYIIVEEPQFMEIFEEAEEEALPQDEQYEEVEFLDNESTEFDFKIESVEYGTSVEARYTCSSCEIQFKQWNSYFRHMNKLHPEAAPLICHICDYSFAPTPGKEEWIHRNMTKHMAAHESGKMNSCMLCPEVFKSQRVLEEHQQRNHSNLQGRNICKGCHKQFSSYQDLQDHLRISNCKENERPFKCFICNETFVMGIAKKKHVQTVHQDKAGADCPLCVRCKIPSAVAFENHYKTHFAGRVNMRNVCLPFYRIISPT